MIPQALAGELCQMMADHQEHKPRPLHTRTWNKLFLAVALSLVLNPAKGSKGGELWALSLRGDYIQLLLVKCSESYASPPLSL